MQPTSMSFIFTCPQSLAPLPRLATYITSHLLHTCYIQGSEMIVGLPVDFPSVCWIPGTVLTHMRPEACALTRHCLSVDVFLLYILTPSGGSRQTLCIKDAILGTSVAHEKGYVEAALE